MNARSNDIHRLEELTLNAWPGLKQVIYDGWVARFSRGFTGRANSVVPLHDGAIDPARKLEFFESLYSAHGLPTTFKLTAASRPPDLDALLATRGYRESRRASVQVCDQLPAGSDYEGVRMRDVVWPEWTDSVIRYRSLTPADASTLSEILSLIALPCQFAVSGEGGDIAACALGVLEAPWIGLYDIVTREDARRRGHAARVVNALMAWGRDNGAASAYLQVMIDNAPAQALYAKLGFRESYQYAYRSKRT